MAYEMGTSSKIAPDVGVGPQNPGATLSASSKFDILQGTLNDLRRMRYFRRQYDQRRAYFYRQYLNQRDQRYFPDNQTPRSNTFVPYAYSNVETIVSRVMDAFFAQDPPFETRGRTPADENSAQQMQDTLLYCLHKANFIPIMEGLVRNISIYGHAGIKVDWDWGYDVVMGKDPIFAQMPNPQTGEPVNIPGPDGQPILQGYRAVTRKVPRACPKFTLIDVYDLLVDPDSVVVAHMTEKTFRQLQLEQAEYKEQTKDEQNPEGKDYYLPEGLATLGSHISGTKNPEDQVIRLAEVWDQDKNAWTILTFGEDSEAISWKDLRASYRAATYSPYKRPFYAGEPILLFHGANPFMHKRNPIPNTSMVKLPNEVFGLGAIEPISDLNEGLNKFVNMIVDNWNTGINRRYAYDVDMDIDHEALNAFNTPGGKVGVRGNPNNVLMPLPIHTPEQGDYSILPVYQQMIEMTGGIADFYSKGVGGSKGNSTATGIAQVIGETNYRFRMFIRNLEVDIVQPVLEMCASMVMQFMPDQIRQMVQQSPDALPAVYPKSPEALIGNFDFDIVAANYATNKVVRQRNLMALTNIYTQSPYTNIYELQKELNKAFEIRNPNILKPPQQVAQEQQQQQQQQVAMMVLQSQLETEGKIKQAQAKEGQGAGGGRPRAMQFEGAIPGSSSGGGAADMAQKFFSPQAMGLEGMGQIPGGG